MHSANNMYVPCWDVCDISIVYHRQGFMAIVDKAAQESMQASVEEVQSFPSYHSDGEVSVTVH